MNTIIMKMYEYNHVSRNGIPEYCTTRNIIVVFYKLFFHFLRACLSLLAAVASILLGRPTPTADKAQRIALLY